MAGNGKIKQAESSSTIKVICAKPRSISFSIENPHNSSCPYSSDTSQVVALSYEPIKVLVTITDDQGRVFDNATSFHIEWLLSSRALGYVDFEGVVILEEKREYNYIIPLYHYQIIHPKNRTGTLVVEGLVSNYRLQQLSTLGIVPEYPVFWIENNEGDKVKPTIKTALTIVLVSDSVVIPEKATVFNHPNNKVTLKISEGSGFYKFHQSSTDIAEVKLKDNTKTIEVTPKTDGLLFLTIIDLCLAYKSPTVEIQVLKVGSIQVEMADRVQKGSSITATVWLYDSVDNALAVPNSELLELRPLIVDGELISVDRLTKDTADGQVKFEITGVKLGTTSIIFTSGYGEREIRSESLPVEVFSPLLLLPQDITLPVGAVFQVSPSGGPQQDFSMDYTSTDCTIAKVTTGGLIEAQKVGDTAVTGTAVGHLKTRVAGGRVVYSRDEVNVHVIHLEGVKIQSPLVKIRVGCRMPVWASGLPDKISPLVLGSIEPPLSFKWSTSVPDVVQLEDVFQSSGIEVTEVDKLSMRVLALKPGRVTLHLNVSGRTARLAEFSDNLSIEVFEALRVIRPQTLDTPTLLMAPYSQMRLRTNKDSVSEVTYTVVGSPEPKYSPQQRTALTSSVPVVSVNRGVVTSHSGLGAASIMVHSNQEYGLKQIVPVNVEVKPVHYIMTSLESQLRVGSEGSIHALPRGLDLHLVVSYHDNEGEVFAATRTNLHIMQNRVDSVKVVRGEANGTLVASLISYGSTVLRVWDESTPKVSQDFIKFKVDHLISPAKDEVTVGDVVCFHMPLVDSKGGGGRWGSVAPDVLWVDPHSGVGRALRPGQTTVKYTLSDSISTSTSITVHPIHNIVFIPLNGHNLTDWGMFSVPLLLLSERDSAAKVCNLLTAGGQCSAPSPSPYHSPFLPQFFPFTCEIRFNSPMAPVDIHQVFNVQPSFSMQTGVYSCHFEALNSPSANTSVLTSNVTLRAISDHLVSEPLVIPFLPSVFLQTKELVLTDTQPAARLSVVGVPQVLSHLQIFSSDANLISVEEARRPDCNQIVFRLSLTGAPAVGRREAHVYVLSPLTGQNVTVVVHLTARAEGLAAPCLAHPSTEMFRSILESLPNIVSIIVIIVILFFSYNCFGGGSIFPVQQAPYPPMATGPVSPIPVYHNGSPHLGEGRPYLYRQPFSDQEPVYGDPSFTHSPELSRRNRR